MDFQTHVPCGPLRLSPLTSLRRSAQHHLDDPGARTSKIRSETLPSQKGMAGLMQRGQGGARRAEDTSGIRHTSPAKAKSQPQRNNSGPQLPHRPGKVLRQLLPQPGLGARPAQPGAIEPKLPALVQLGNLGVRAGEDKGV